MWTINIHIQGCMNKRQQKIDQKTKRLYQDLKNQNNKSVESCFTFPRHRNVRYMLKKMTIN